MKEYRTVWVSQWVDKSTGSPQELPDIDQVTNNWAAAGWRLTHMAPGTNAQTYSGLFLTFERD